MNDSTSVLPATDRPSSPPVDAWLDAFDAHIGHLAANGRSWLGPLRRSAIAGFAERGLPSPRDEDWRHTPLRAHLAPRYRPAPHAELDAAAAARLAELSLDGLGEHRLVFVNGRLHQASSNVGRLPEGAKLMSLAAAVESEPALVEPYLARVAANARARSTPATVQALAHMRREPGTAPIGGAPSAEPAEHAFAALNTAFMLDGAFLFLPDGARIEAPIEIIHLQIASADTAEDRGGARLDADGAAGGDPDSGATAPVAIFPRSLIVAGRDSAAHVIETYAGVDPAGAGYLTVSVTEASVSEGADVRWTKRQDEPPSAVHIGRFEGRQTGASALTTHAITLGGKLVRNEIAVSIDAEDCTTALDGLYMARGDQHVENRTRLDHAMPNCHSEEHYKGILDGRASAVFAGRIYVHQDAQKTDAFQENSCLLLSRSATVFTQPQLEIFADDVKCTHGATVGELDAGQLFYLRARGLPPAEAHGILTYGYANEIVEGLGIPALQAQLEAQIRERVRESHAQPGPGEA